MEEHVAQPSGSARLRAVVVGAGLGGLGTALALRQGGVDVEVYEQATDLSSIQVGGGLHMWTNAMRVLQKLGVADVVTSIGAPLESTEFCSAKGRLFGAWPVGEIGRSLSAPDHGISRKDLHRTLAEAVGSASVHTGATMEALEQDGAGVTVRFADGRVARADLLVGADGLHSTVRRHLLGEAPLRYAGYAQWQGIVDDPSSMLPAGVERVIFGRGERAVLHHVGPGRLFWAAVVYGPEGGYKRNGDRRSWLLERFNDFTPPVTDAIGATPERAISAFDIYDRPPAGGWSNGAATLVGDAAHPMTTNLSQGGCQALEDGVVLAECLAAEPDVPTALRRYEARRLPRTSALVRNSFRLAQVGGFRNPVACAVRNTVFTVGLPRVGLKDHRRLMTEEP